VKFITRLLIGALSLALAAYVVPGIYIDDWITLLVASLLFGIVNAFIRPFIVLLTLPFTIVTFGLFLFIINAALFALVAWIIPGFYVRDFISAFAGWLIVAITTFLVTHLIKE